MASEARLSLEIADSDSIPPAIQALIPRVAAGVAEQLGLRGTVALRVCDDAAMQILNARFRGIDRPTDVLAFPVDDGSAVRPDLGVGPAGYPGLKAGPQERIHRGDVAISFPRVRTQARASGHSVEREFAYLLTHALLHLCGMSHADAADTAAMRVAEERVLTPLGLTRSGPASPA